MASNFGTATLTFNSDYKPAVTSTEYVAVDTPPNATTITAVQPSRLTAPLTLTAQPIKSSLQVGTYAINKNYGYCINGTNYTHVYVRSSTQSQHSIIYNSTSGDYNTFRGERLFDTGTLAVAYPLAFQAGDILYSVGGTLTNVYNLPTGVAYVYNNSPFTSALVADPTNNWSVMSSNGTQYKISTDLGQTWGTATAFPGSTTGLFATGSTIIAVTGTTTYYATSNFSTFSTYTAPIAITANNIVVIMGPTNTQVIIWSGTTVYRSTDDGLTWPVSGTCPINPAFVSYQKSTGRYYFLNSTGSFTYTTDFTSWSTSTPSFITQLGGTAPVIQSVKSWNDNNSFIVATWEGSHLFLTTDFTTGTTSTLSFNVVGTGYDSSANQGVRYIDGKYILPNINGGGCLYTTDGTNIQFDAGGPLNTTLAKNSRTSITTSTGTAITYWMDSNPTVSKTVTIPTTVNAFYGGSIRVDDTIIGVTGDANGSFTFGGFTKDGSWSESIHAASLPVSTTWINVIGGAVNGSPIYIAFVTTALSTQTARSTNGITWTSQALPAAVTHGSAIFAEGKFVVVGLNASNQAVVFYSTDGITWTSSTVGASAAGKKTKIAYGNGVWFVASNATIWFSYDLTTWTSTSFNLNLFTNGVYTDSTFEIASLDFFLNNLWVWPVNGSHCIKVSVPGVTYSTSNTTPSRSLVPVTTTLSPVQNSAGSNFASVTVTGQGLIQAGDAIDVWIQGDDFTADHNAEEHKFLPISLKATNIVPNQSFDILAFSEYRIKGDIKVRWAWST